MHVFAVCAAYGLVAVVSFVAKVSEGRRRRRRGMGWRIFIVRMNWIEQLNCGKRKRTYKE